MLIAEPIVILDYCWWLIELPHHFEIYSLLLLLFKSIQEGGYLVLTWSRGGPGIYNKKVPEDQSKRRCCKL